MSGLTFIPPPKGLIGRPYGHSRDWLDINFYEQLCSYCLLQFKETLHIEHHEPQAYNASKINDPSNLLLGCPWCNSGKSDYHPNHATRRRLPRENRGFSVIDIRIEDFAGIFEICPDGSLRAKNGSEQERVEFNITALLRLNTKSRNERRVRCLDYLYTCEGLLNLNDTNEEIDKAINVLVRECAERRLFYKAFDIPLSEALLALVEDYITKNRPQLVS